jgi:hypothetical protein
MLALDDPRWKELDHRGWTEGKRYDLDSDAPYVPEALSALLSEPGNVERFSSLWPYLCSEGTAWAAAYAAVPYVVEVASRLPPDRRFEHLYFVGLVVIYSYPEDGESFAIKPYLVDSYRAALERALPLLAETLVCQLAEVREIRELLAVAAALKGYPELGAMLQRPEFSVTCRKCGDEVTLRD